MIINAKVHQVTNEEPDEKLIIISLSAPYKWFNIWEIRSTPKLLTIKLLLMWNTIEIYAHVYHNCN